MRGVQLRERVVASADRVGLGGCGYGGVEPYIEEGSALRRDERKLRPYRLGGIGVEHVGIHFWGVTPMVWGVMFQPRMAIWGVAFDAAAVGYSTSISRVSPERSET